VKTSCNIFVLVAYYNDTIVTVFDYYFTSAEEALLAAEEIQSEAEKSANYRCVVAVKTLKPGVLKNIK
jgi:hypothetical protein